MFIIWSATSDFCVNLSSEGRLYLADHDSACGAAEKYMSERGVRVVLPCRGVRLSNGERFEWR
jgi:hypothetical protein